MGFICKEDGSWEKASSFDKNHPEIGQELAYPTSYENFNYLCRIPEDAARVWLKTINYAFKPDGQDDPLCNWAWENKLAIVVAMHHEIPLAVYQHDDSFWLVMRSRKRR